MRNYNLKVAVFLASCLILSACGEAALVEGARVTTTNVPLPVPIATLASFNTVSPTSTPKATIQPSLSPASSLKPTNSPSVTAIRKPSYDWKTDNVCEPPCWQNIKPGVTTFAEAKKILQSLTFVEQLEENRDYRETDLIWIWKGANRTTTRMSFRSENNKTVVNRIFLAYPTVFTLEELITKFGQPSHALTGVSGNHTQGIINYTAELLYQNKGIFLYHYFYVPDKPELEPSLKLQHFEFSDKPLSDSINKFMKQWQGYKPFEFYCRNCNP
jgi:hypothetical protein